MELAKIQKLCPKRASVSWISRSLASTPKQRFGEDTFDTMRAGSDALAAYINGIEDGTMVLIGARDEALIASCMYTL